MAGFGEIPKIGVEQEKPKSEKPAEEVDTSYVDLAEGSSVQDPVSEAEEVDNKESAQSLERDKVEKKADELAIQRFGMGYLDEVVKHSEAPEAYIWNGRRILRSTLQTLSEELKKTGVVEVRKGGWESNKASSIEELETQDPMYKDFVEALNEMMRQYDKLFRGSERIYTDFSGGSH
jgi:hypothetical protein